MHKINLSSFIKLHDIENYLMILIMVSLKSSKFHGKNNWAKKNYICQLR
jgi:hypothetical protein